ncbi:LptF/LptG family permease [Flavobacterium sp. CYK-55]|uniref:LptF/LptG family permease n=1 Tax=Flavobacterium sp. CYK-55 TaxID=2835529 RepID=UPI001BD1657F|nr:LptF/LptG family permease [Flavobacterium sp. CYK-55]MBS7787694.1 LptF/LptG family permease [Flavobacterium sp. CYK-55]
MKILDRYILKSFLTTFTSVFVILLLIFILQTVWLFIAELAGKDLDFVLIVKFLLFKMPSLVPLVLPLSVLLASIMTFGSLAENYEFAAMKSAGISLQRSMRGLTFFIILLSFCAFFFANNVIPYAEYKFINFRRSIAQMKPAMAIAEGQFSDVGLYNIKVEKKSGPNGNFLTGVTIHKKVNDYDGSKNVIKAKTGELVSSENSNILQLILRDGFYYEDIIPKKYEDRNKMPFAKSSFKRYVINIDLTKLKSADSDEDLVKDTDKMLNIKELLITIDSLNTDYQKDVTSIADNSFVRNGLAFNASKPADESKKFKQNILSNYSVQEQANLLRVASSSITSYNFSVESYKNELFGKTENINEHWIAVYDKLVIAFACLLMFFIGAPLGAIIRKGGLGLPIVFAVTIFILFHFINTFGKKVAQENEITPFMGCWLSSMVLLPLAILLTYRATNDIGLINLDNITVPIQKLFQKILPTKSEEN